ncbi:AMP-binding protein [Bordetella genomosp. 13]|uniref:AMP-binding protein n=1 Tax=Bordetella genomosp. 13 TaxID=463040 RepID=UPI00119D4A00|nr:AMP-binding protein [Bordetella genomosp. 13]
MAWIALHRLLEHADADPGRLVAHEPALPHDGFVRHALAAAGTLQAAGMRRAGLWFEDAAQLAIALYACWRAGVVAVLPGDARPATCAALDADVDGWIGDMPGLPVPAARYRVLHTLYDAAPALAPGALDPDAAGIELCTSGSSGQPKRIAKRWRQLATEIEAFEQQWHWADSPACVLGSVSPQHMYGLPFRVLWPLCAGRAIARRQLVYPEALQHASLPHDACVWIVSPALLKRLGNSLDRQVLAPRLRQIYSSGGPLPADTSDSVARDLRCRPVEIYGSSETGATAWRQGDTLWQPLPAVRIGLNDENALWVESPWLGDAREQTADAARLTGAGFQLLGRMDRIVKIEEKRIALPALEDALARHPLVREARLGLAAHRQRLTALVALSGLGVHTLRNGGRKALAHTLRLYLAEHAEPLAVPRAWRFLRELPWNEQGKLPQHRFEAAAVRPQVPHVLDIRADGAAPQACSLSLEIPLDLPCFDGHFPQAPVVPGIVQVGWALDYARGHLDPSLGFYGMEVLKFQRLVRPGDVVALTLRHEPARGRVVFDYRMDGHPCSSGRILTHAPAEAAA